MDHSNFVGRRSGHSQTAEDHLQCFGLPNNPGQALGATAAREDANARLGQSNCRYRRPGDAQVASQRKLKASTHAQTIYRCDNRFLN